MEFIRWEGILSGEAQEKQSGNLVRCWFPARRHVWLGFAGSQIRAGTADRTRNDWRALAQSGSGLECGVGLRGLGFFDLKFVSLYMFESSNLTRFAVPG
jgi:hypothetical protein